MAGRKPGPGQSQLGHSPLGRTKLEGPKKHHDYHGSTDSVPGKGNKEVNSSGHWEKHYGTEINPKAAKFVGTEWQPMRAKDRMACHVKVNEQDH